MCSVLCVYQSPQQQQQQHSIWKCNSAFPKVVTDVHPFFFFISSSYSEKQHLSRMIFFSKQKNHDREENELGTCLSEKYHVGIIYKQTHRREKPDT
jgi:hypothetical protein